MASAKAESMARGLWRGFRNESNLALYSPFVVALLSGNLTHDTFLNHASQELYFLKCLQHALELAEECAENNDDMISISLLRKGVLKNHIDCVLNWIKENPVNPTTVRCTDFLLATASGELEGVEDLVTPVTPFEKAKVVAYTLGAMIPCMRLYAFICKKLPDASGSSHPYKKWIEKYSSANFKEFTFQIEQLLDKLSVSMKGKERDIIQKLYRQAMKSLIDFIFSQPMVQKTVVPLLKDHNFSENRLMVFTDFDVTCSVTDSSYILANISLHGRGWTVCRKNNARAPLADLENTWALITREYDEELTKCLEKILLTEKVEIFNYTGLKKALQPFTDLRNRAYTIVIKSGVLKGLNLQDIKRAGERLKLQDGCISFFQSIFKNENTCASIHVLSHCLCDDLIMSAFSSGGLHVDIHGNELIYEESIATGDIVRNIECAIDKVECFDNILVRNKSKKKLIVYIGHTVGDLLCLLKADIGIVFRPTPCIKRIGSHFGVSFVPLFQVLVGKQKEMVQGGSSCSWRGGLSGIVYTVSSWAEIRALIVGL